MNSAQTRQGGKYGLAEAAIPRETRAFLFSKFADNVGGLGRRGFRRERFSPGPSSMTLLSSCWRASSRLCPGAPGRDATARHWRWRRRPFREGEIRSPPACGDGAVLVLFDLKPWRETPVENGAKVPAVTSDAMMVVV